MVNRYQQHIPRLESRVKELEYNVELLLDLIVRLELACRKHLVPFDARRSTV